jgi:formate dehydrogenase iron-sulfur subunit
MAKALLYDATLCIGCLNCEGACAEQNKLLYDDVVAKEKKNSDHKYSYVAVKADKGEEKYMRRMCMHCVDPTCVSACPVGALEKTKLGPVTYNVDKCMGCRYCMVACPFGVPKYEWSKALPGVRKCIMCNDRVAAGKQTACAEACPTGATIFGERDALIAEAHRRIAADPAKYIDHVYGEHEAGGTSVLLLSSVPFEQFGLPSNLGSTPLPYLTADIIHRVPQVATAGWAVLGGIWWITNRREAVAAADEARKDVKS